jgi:hypothetical protein
MAAYDVGTQFRPATAAPSGKESNKRRCSSPLIDVQSVDQRLIIPRFREGAGIAEGDDRGDFTSVGHSEILF